MSLYAHHVQQTEAKSLPNAKRAREGLLHIRNSVCSVPNPSRGVFWLGDPGRVGDAGNGRANSETEKLLNFIVVGWTNEVAMEMG